LCWNFTHSSFCALTPNLTLTPGVDSPAYATRLSGEDWACDSLREQT
jgi:hypothetical protein